MNIFMKGLNNIAGWIGSKHRQLEAMEPPDWLEKGCDKVWKMIPPDMHKVLWGLINQLSAKYGKEYAKKIVDAVFKALKEIIEKLKGSDN